MRFVVSAAALLLIVALSTIPAAAQVASGDEEIDQRLEQALLAGFLEVQCPIPNIRPKVANITRGWTPNADELISTFFGSRDNIMSSEQVVSPLWGRGTRYKSGTVITVSQNQSLGMRQYNPGGVQNIESVATHLDVYESGFVYANQVPHKAVYATDVKITGETTSDIDRFFVYNEREGQLAAETLIKETLGNLEVAGGFQENVKVIIEDFGEKLFVYRANPEYITEYITRDGSRLEGNTVVDGEVTGSQSAAVPVYDAHVHVKLDGDKMLAGIEYFWDNNLKASGTPKECIHAGTAFMYAKEKLFEEYNGQPPLLTVTNIKIGYIQDRRNRRKLLPVWLFDAWHQTSLVDNSDRPPGTKRPAGHDVEYIAHPFAVNALTGELILL